MLTQKLNKYIVILYILLATTVANAQQYERFRLPQGRRLVVASATYQGFNLGEYQELLRMDADLRLLTETHGLDAIRIAELTASATEFSLAVTSCREEVNLLTSERLRLTNLYEEENRRRHEAENRPSFSWIPWTLAGGLAIATVILSFVVVAQ